jgi:hypothetical protein
MKRCLLVGAAAGVVTAIATRLAMNWRWTHRLRAAKKAWTLPEERS